MRQRTPGRHFYHTGILVGLLLLGSVAARRQWKTVPRTRSVPGTRRGHSNIFTQGTCLPFLREIDCRLQPPIPSMERGLLATWGAISAPPPMPLVPPLWILSAGKRKLMLWSAG